MSRKVLRGFLLISIILLLLFFGYVFAQKKLNVSAPSPLPSSQPQARAVVSFFSEEDFKSYLARGERSRDRIFGGTLRMPAEAVSLPLAVQDKAVVERTSETNVQVKGIDEPDIVKTDGKEIYFSPQNRYVPLIRSEEPMMDQKMIAPPYSPHSPQGVRVVKAFPPNSLTFDSELKQTGDLLLSDGTLIVFSQEKLYGYDVTDPKRISEKWSIGLKENVHIVTSRLYKDTIYLVTQTGINRIKPCPIEPFMIKDTPISIPCPLIYHPTVYMPLDVTYTVSKIKASSGEIENTFSFAGPSQNRIVSMSEQALYVTYSYTEDYISFINAFLRENTDLFPPEMREKLSQLEGYEISSISKLSELKIIIEEYQNSLDNDGRLKLENELKNRLTQYMKVHSRELEKTGIVKVDLSQLKIGATGSVAGKPLNQFSLDEYQGYVRLATTTGGNNMFLFPFGNGSESVNDVYILDQNLRETGSVKDLGKGEQIYAVRFIGNRGYMVTFRQIDPFFVLDLSDAGNPVKKGELKIPGYSSYLEPLSNDRVLGIGKEDAYMKLSLFDVANAGNPQELNTYHLDEYWSDILSTHHAFLRDEKHHVFFLPGGKGGYIFSYKNDTVKLVKAISGIVAKRALYINDYLYLMGEDKIIVLSETNWEKVNELDLIQ